MLRSLDYARHAALNQVAKTPPEMERLAAPSREWLKRARAAFLEAYGQAAQAGGLYAADSGFVAALGLVRLFEIEKALYELRYELNNRPDWVGVPLAGIAELTGLAP
jgi:maltose alpha-D-glucosyltransferase/alpha-amylase